MLNLAARTTKPVPQYPFEDLFYFSGSQYILMVDSFSGYDDFVKMDEMTSHSAIVFFETMVFSPRSPERIS
jgi:hypothetical protein